MTAPDAVGALVVDTLAVDLDGTALDSRGVMAAATAAALNRAADRGVRIVFVSARPLWSLRDRTSALAVPGAAVACGGAVVADERDRVLRRRGLDEATLAAVTAAVAGSDMSALCYSDDTAFRVGDSALLREEIGVTVRGEPGPWTGGRADKVLVFADEGSRAAVAVDQVQGVVTTLSHPGLLEVTAAGVDKGSGVRTVLAHLGTGPERLAAVGDGNNDVPMLRLAARGFAVANGSERARGAADRVVGSNDETGVADVVAQLLEGQ